MIDTILSGSLPSPRFEKKTVAGASAGAGLKAQHVDDILQLPATDVDFFEVHAENYMGAGGRPHAQLHAIREKYPISVHGVGMSIGSPGRIDPQHLARFKAIVDHYQPVMVSEHLAWSTHDDVFYNDLLPLPYTNETLQSVVDHVVEVQEAIGRQILIENPSTYVTFGASTWAEFDFMAEIANRSGCGLLFDVNNVYVSATNHGFSPEDYIDAYPLEKVAEIHLAGHATDSDDDGDPLLIDSHDREVAPDVWKLFDRVLQRTGPIPSLIEWDNEVPEWETLASEVANVKSRLHTAAERSRRVA